MNLYTTWFGYTGNDGIWTWTICMQLRQSLTLQGQVCLNVWAWFVRNVPSVWYSVLWKNALAGNIAISSSNILYLRTYKNCCVDTWSSLQGYKISSCSSRTIYSGTSGNNTTKHTNKKLSYNHLQEHSSPLGVSSL